MKCDQCHTEIKSNEKYFTAVGMNICEKCNEKNNGTISLDFILDHIRKNE
jgi:peptide subunit release factor 1 (eRF1)